MNIQQAIQLISDIVPIQKISSFMKPLRGEKIDQPSFLNAVLQASIPNDAPEEFLTKLQEIERTIGRKKREKWGPREIDIDILFWEIEQYKRIRLRFPIRIGKSVTLS